MNNNPSNALKGFTDRTGSSKKNTLLMALGSFLVVLMGIGTGYLLSGSSASSGRTGSSIGVVENGDGKMGGVNEESEITDSESPIGILVEGGIEGEGTHHIERPGGPSKNVYLTSTVLDLQSFVGKKVQVQGETLSGVKAGWLMDVVKIKVVN